jgi:hypothetical protein
MTKKRVSIDFPSIPVLQLISSNRATNVEDSLNVVACGRKSGHR